MGNMKAQGDNPSTTEVPTGQTKPGYDADYLPPNPKSAAGTGTPTGQPSTGTPRVDSVNPDPHGGVDVEGDVPRGFVNPAQTVATKDANDGVGRPFKRVQV